MTVTEVRAEPKSDLQFTKQHETQQTFSLVEVGLFICICKSLIGLPYDYQIWLWSSGLRGWRNEIADPGNWVKPGSLPDD